MFFLHYDDNENIMCQFDGEKVFLLFDVTDFDFMYPRSKADFRSVVGQNGDFSPSLADYPLLARATPYIARIGRGDMLYLPCY